MLQVLSMGIAVVAGYQGATILLRLGPRQRLYGYLLLIDAACALGGAFPLDDDPAPRQEILAAVSVFGFVLLMLVPPLLRSLARAAMLRERLGLAAWLTSLREHLQPGFGARQEREVIDVIRAVEAGKGEAIVAELRARRAIEAEPAIRRALDDRIVFTLIYSGRWREAIDAFEQSAVGAPTGLALLVDVVGAYGETGDLDKAAELVARLLESPAAREPTLVRAFAQARLQLLAFAGRPDAVTALVSPRAPLAGMSRALRSYWIGTARLFAGDRAGARAALLEAASASAGRTARLARERLAQVDDDSFVTPRAMPLSASLTVDQVAGATQEPGPQPVRLEGITWRMIPVTLAIVTVNLAVHAAVSLRFGTTVDPAVLIRAGANFQPAVAGGEWWRLLSATFLHVGAIHLVVNMLGLWSLGRLTEQFYGPLRYAIVYLVAGLGGSLASHFFGPGQVSAGASGALFGILGAAIVDLWIGPHRTAGTRFRRALLWNLLFLGAANLIALQSYKMIDQAAHIGGLVAGAACGLAVSRLRSQALAWGLAVALGAVAIASGALAAATPLVRTFDRAGWTGDNLRHVMGVGAELVDAVDERLLRENLQRTEGVTQIEPDVAPPQEGWHAAAFRARLDGEEGLSLYYWRFRGAKAQLFRFDLPGRDRELLLPLVERVLQLR